MTEQILARLENIEQNGAGGSGGGITKETDPTVPDWAKQPDPPKYTAADVGAATAQQVSELSTEKADKENAIYILQAGETLDDVPEEYSVAMNPNEDGGEFPEGGDVQIDETLTQSGMAADAAVVGQKFAEQSEVIADKRTSAMWYGTTSPEPYTAEKVVTTETGDFELVRGARIGVKFLTDTVHCSSLIVDGAERVHIRSTNDEKGETGETGSSSTNFPVVWHNLGQVQWFTYDGEYFIVDDSVRATAENQLCGKVSVSDSVNSTGDTVASSTAVKTAYDKAMEAMNAVTALDAALAEAIGSGVIA